jgi:hypothetical protein
MTKRRPNKGKTIPRMVKMVWKVSGIGIGIGKWNSARFAGRRGLCVMEAANHIHPTAKAVKNKPPMMLKMVCGL